LAVVQAIVAEHPIGILRVQGMVVMVMVVVVAAQAAAHSIAECAIGRQIIAAALSVVTGNVPAVMVVVVAYRSHAVQAGWMVATMVAATVSFGKGHRR
jgi:hypothetical protein